ncbi:MAG: sugar phosphate isomerase/epimerase family protein [Micrococcales bacterium]
MSFKYGVSLFSFTNDYGVVMDLEDSMRIISDLGATGIEILGEGHIPNYPNPTDEWLSHWFELLKKYNLEATNYGSWIDTRLHKGQTIDGKTGAEMLQRDLRLASKLGFKFVRPKIGVVSSELDPDPSWDEAVERSLDLAAELDIIICPEIHQPTPIKHPVVDGYIDFIQRTGTKHFGLLIDTGIFQDPETRPAYMRGPKVEPEHLLDIKDYIVFIQAKFINITDDFTDEQIPWQPVLQALKDSGYEGYLSSEYEGERLPWRGVDQVRRQHALMRKVEASLN